MQEYFTLVGLVSSDVTWQVPAGASCARRQINSGSCPSHGCRAWGRPAHLQHKHLQPQLAIDLHAQRRA